MDVFKEVEEGDFSFINDAEKCILKFQVNDNMDVVI